MARDIEQQLGDLCVVCNQRPATDGDVCSDTCWQEWIDAMGGNDD